MGAAKTAFLPCTPAPGVGLCDDPDRVPATGFPAASRLTNLPRPVIVLPMSGAFLPRWLLILIALGVIGGQWHQMECKVFGHRSVVASTSVEHGGKVPQPTGGAGDGCPFQCEFSACIASGMTPVLAPVFRLATANPPERSDRAPEAVCAEIDLPPQLA